MTSTDAIEIDALIFGGGVAGLWLLDELRRGDRRVLLLESAALGRGQTAASQGIIHGGLKYTLTGLFTASADAIREMPAVWRACLRGERRPDLRATPIRAEYCHLWRTDDLRSRAGMLGARIGLRVAPARLEREAWPAALRGCPGAVFRLDEQVIDPVGLVCDLARQNAAHVLRYDPHELKVERARDGRIRIVEVCSGAAAAPRLALRPRFVILAAGAGNADLRARFGLSEPAMQLRPLHMVMLRGALPELNGHCADGARTRVTVTTAHDSAGRRIWQVGGQLAEDGVSMDRGALIAHARAELTATLPGVALDNVEWGAYRVDRAEAACGGKRPETISVRQEGNVITAWPTKLALAPQLAAAIAARLEPNGAAPAAYLEAVAEWPRPVVAQPPWEEETAWSPAD